MLTWIVAARYWPYSNVQPFNEFRKTLRNISRYASSCQHHTTGMLESPIVLPSGLSTCGLNMNIPFITRLLAVEYFFICSTRE